MKIKSLAKTFQRYVPLPNRDYLEFNEAYSLSTLWGMLDHTPYR